MNRRWTTALVLSVALLALPSTASASYLDPGFGSLLVQGLVASFAAAVATLAMYWRSAVALFHRLTHTNPRSKSSPRQGS